MKIFVSFGFFATLIFSLFQKEIKAQKTLELKSEKTESYIGQYLEILEDANSSLSFQEALKSNNFKQVESTVPNLGVTSKSNWVKFKAINLSDKNNFIIQLALATIDYVDYYAIYEDGHIDSVKTGDCRLIDSKTNKRPDFTFNITLNKNEIIQILFKVRGGEQVQMPINIGEQAKLLESFDIEDVLMGIYVGIILTMILYNIFIFFSTKDKSYLFYVAYIITVGLTQLNFLGYTTKYIWPNAIFISQIAVYILSALTAISAMEFMKRFLFTKTKCAQLHKYYIFFYIIYYVAIVFALFGKFNWSYRIIQINAMLAASFMLYVAYKILIQGFRPAKYFMVAWCTFLVGVTVFVLKDIGVLPYNKITYYMMTTGSALEVILLSFALADRINTLKKQNSEIMEQQNLILEFKVKERTEELESMNKSLKETQSQLINAEKMASLGQLTAGISHEINNPINFVVSNIKPLKRDVQEILSILDKYNEIKDSTNLKEKLEEINALKKKLDSDYLKNEINQLLKGIDEGANRTSEIVKGLKNFARADEGDIKKINIHEGIDATLTLLNNNIMSYGIRIIKNYNDLPLIECYPGKINQVLMNLLSNAVDAIKALKIKDREPVILIETQVSNNNVIIKISDNGIGIPESIISKIFDPFYTTKDVGQGTGLGLSIVYGIIKSHQGKIEVQSEVNKSTTFVITLPIQHTH